MATTHEQINQQHPKGANSPTEKRIMEPVYLLAGQSNMAGRCQERELSTDLLSPSPVPVNFCYGNDSNFGQTSVGDWGDLRGQPSSGLGKTLFGPEFGLAETLASRCWEGKNGCQRVHFLKFVMGSTNLHSNWNPGNVAATETEGVKPGFRAHYQEFISF